MNTIVEEIKNGDYTNYLELEKKYHPLIHNTIHLLGLDKDREDAFQVASALFFDCVLKYNPDKAQLITYYASSLYNKLRNFRKDLYANNHKQLEDDMVIYEENNQESFEDMIECLDDEEKTIIRDVFYYGYNYNEVGEKLNKNKTYIYRKIKLILKKLAYNISEE